MGENNHFFGKTHTEETKRKMKESAKGRIPRTKEQEDKRKAAIKEYWNNRRNADN